MQDRFSDRYVAPGAAHVAPAGDGPTMSVTFVLVPNFTMLAFSSALEPFRIANQLAGRRLFRWAVFGRNDEAVMSSSGIAVSTDGSLPREVTDGYVLVCGGVTPEKTMSRELGNWLRAQWRRGRVIGGLCTGTYALAHAGILSGHHFTLHWENIPGFCEKFPDLEPERRIFCMDDRILSCAGGVAAADLSLALIAQHYGAPFARVVMEMCLLSNNRSGEEAQVSSLAARLASRNAVVVRAAEFLEANLEDGFDLAACARHAGVAPRQVQRLFRSYLGMTPRQYANDLRLAHGRMLLAGTNLPVLDVAIACGYATRSAFSKGFRLKYGCAPQHFTNFRG